jgi:oligoribonuclease NrnB/cAMP/cGMP phosphodiesterase (DHH superfamily)
VKIATHTDIDGICCAALFIRKFGSDIEIVYATVNEAKNLADYEAKVDYTCDLPKIGKSINIDHHKSNYEDLRITNRLTESDCVNPTAASAADLVFKNLTFDNDPIAEEIRSLGHLADIAQLPEKFRPLDIVLNMNVDNKAFLRQVSELLAKHGNEILSSQWLKNNYSEVREIYTKTHLNITRFLNEVKEFPSILILDTRQKLPGKLAKEVIRPLFKRGVAVLAIVYKKSSTESVRVSFRVTKVKQDLYDVSVVAKAFGGGGHRMAAACSPKTEEIPIKLKRELSKIAQEYDVIKYIIL